MGNKALGGRDTWIPIVDSVLSGAQNGACGDQIRYKNSHDIVVNRRVISTNAIVLPERISNELKRLAGGDLLHW